MSDAMTSVETQKHLIGLLLGTENDWPSWRAQLAHHLARFC